MTVAQPDLRTGNEPHCDPEEGCITCGDVAEELRVLRIDPDRGLALCSDSAERHSTVEIALVDPVEIGDALLVHAGTAIAKLDQPAAEEMARA